MFRYFKTKEWLLWSWGGLVVIVSALWYLVNLDVEINEWFGRFYNTLQEALATPGAVTVEQYNAHLFEFAAIAAEYVIIAIASAYFTAHWTFRWRQSMAEFYHEHWVGDIEGASQRVQEDTAKFSRIVESLGSTAVEYLLQLLAFAPILFTLSSQLVGLPFFGYVEGSMMWVAIATALGGTLIMIAVGVYLPGIEFDIQKREAAYRKVLVHAEDNIPKNFDELTSDLFAQVRGIHFKYFFHYLYFNATKFSFLQGMVVVPYIALGPTIVAGAVTLGVVSQISRAFGKVAESLQFFVRSWGTVVELISVYKRLRQFEDRINSNEVKNL